MNPKASKPKGTPPMDEMKEQENRTDYVGLRVLLTAPEANGHGTFGSEPLK